MARLRREWPQLATYWRHVECKVQVEVNVCSGLWARESLNVRRALPWDLLVSTVWQRAMLADAIGPSGASSSPGA